MQYAFVVPNNRCRHSLTVIEGHVNGGGNTVMTGLRGNLGREKCHSYVGGFPAHGGVVESGVDGGV